MPAAASVAKAYIQLVEPKSDGTGGNQGPPLTFQFNPKELQIQQQTEWEQKPAKGAKKASPPEWKGAKPKAFSVEMLLDNTEPRIKVDLEGIVKKLFDAVIQDPNTSGKNKSAPFVKFGWGTQKPILAIVKQVQVKYTLFTAEGTPLRALCTVQMEEYPRANGPTNPSSGGDPARRAHTILQGESLPGIAYREYGTPGLWRALADVNGIDDPMRLQPGRRLLVPPPEEAALHG
jgi:nucleoid-associated protein YgaU